MKKKIVTALMTAALGTSLLFSQAAMAADNTAKTEDTAKDEDKESDGEQFEDTTITVFAAKSLNGVVDELIAMYNEEQPNVEVAMTGQEL